METPNYTTPEEPFLKIIVQLAKISEQLEKLIKILDHKP